MEEGERTRPRINAWQGAHMFIGALPKCMLLTPLAQAMVTGARLALQRDCMQVWPALKAFKGGHGKLSSGLLTQALRPALLAPCHRSRRQELGRSAIASEML